MPDTPAPAFVSMPEAVQEFERQLQAQNEDDFFPTGYPSHDCALGRLRRASLTLVGARPSMGKTAYMLCSALRQLEAGIRVYFFSLEMPRADMIARLVSINTGVNLLDILQRRIDANDAARIVGVLPQLKTLHADWTEEAALKKMTALFGQIPKRSRSIVYVDFLGLIQIPGLGATDSYAASTEIGLALKRAAMQLEIPIVAGVQLNRQIEQRREKHPLLSDFRDSGRLEEIADVALGLHRPGFYEEKLPDNELQVFCLKNRNGPRKNYVLQWEGSCARASEKSRLSWPEVA